MSVIFDTAYIEYANGTPTMVVFFENLISSTDALTCTAVTGISNIRECSGEDNFNKNGVF